MNERPRDNSLNYDIEPIYWFLVGSNDFLMLRTDKAFHPLTKSIFLNVSVSGSIVSIFPAEIIFPT